MSDDLKRTRFPWHRRLIRPRHTLSALLLFAAATYLIVNSISPSKSEQQQQQQRPFTRRLQSGQGPAGPGPATVNNPGQGYGTNQGPGNGPGAGQASGTNQAAGAGPSPGANQGAGAGPSPGANQGVGAGPSAAEITPNHDLAAIEKGPAIATLASNNEEDLRELCLAMKSLLFLRGGPTREWTKSPVLIFNEGDITQQQRNTVSACTSRPVAFPVVNLHSFPKGFNEENEWKAFSKLFSFRPVRERHHWSYAQMIRFWTTLIWRHPAIQQYSIIMRIDTDSCFLWQRDDNLNHLYKEAPGLSGRYVYQSNYENYVGGDTHYIEGLYHFAVQYMEKENIKPNNPALWDVIKTTWEEQRNLPVFQTNFEISRKSFFRREDVMKWHEALAERHPFGIFRKRWGDAQFRVFTMAMFAKEENVLLSKSTGYLHGRGRCAKNFISEIHEQLKTKERW